MILLSLVVIFLPVLTGIFLWVGFLDYFTRWNDRQTHLYVREAITENNGDNRAFNFLRCRAILHVKYLIVFLLIGSLQSCIMTQQPTADIDYNGGGRKVPFKERKTHGRLSERLYHTDFNAVDIDVPIETEIVNSNRSEVRVSAPQKVLERLIVDEKQGMLFIRFGQGFTHFQGWEAHIKIYTRRLTALRTTNTVTFRRTVNQPHIKIRTTGEVRGDFEVEDMAIQTDNIGRFLGSVWARHLDLSVWDISKVDISGRVSEINAEARGSSQILGKNLNVERGNLNTREKARLSFTVSKDARATASEESEITVFKNATPKIDKEERGRARVWVR